MKLSDIKNGDFLYYTERPFSNYADSLVEILEINGELVGHTVCTNWEGQYINVPYEESEDLPLAPYYDENCWYPTTYSLKDGDASIWMNKTYPPDKPSIIPVKEIYALYKSSMFYPYASKIVGLFTDKNLLELAMNSINVSNSSVFKFYYETYEPNKIGD
jgi:hypothetical protein